MSTKLASLLTRLKYGPHLKTVVGGDIRYLKAQHFDTAGKLLEVTDSFADPAAQPEAHCLREGQVIVAGKGNRRFAWAYRTSAGPCIASSLFYVLTVRTELVEPRYLALFLNTASCVRAQNALAKGATIPVIPKRELSNLSLPIPGLEAQGRAIKLDELQQRRQQIIRKISELTATLDNARLEQLLTPEN